MGTRFRLFMVFAGAMFVVAVFTYPIWRPAPVEDRDITEFAGISAELQADFQRLEESIQQDYLAMRLEDDDMAKQLLIARLTSPEVLPPEQQALPPVEGAVIIGEGQFGPLQLAQDDERMLPPFSELYGSAGALTIYQFVDGRRLLYIENLNIINGPNLWVSLSLSPNPLTSDDFGREDIDLGPSLAASGSMSYEVPDVPRGLEISDYYSVIIYERDYGIIFSVASIK
jgi:hypothetical protein